MQNGGSHCNKPPKKQGSRNNVNDELTVGTNDYSLVSKRSVEKLYYRNEPQFLRPFVAKYKRRSPLVNRCCWLRMKAVNHIVQQFISRPGSGELKRVIVNLGCGYDSLPFRTRWRYPSESEDVIFIDLDDPGVIERKLTIVTRQNRESGLYDTRNYIGTGCDLRNLSSLASILDEIAPPQKCQILLIAEDLVPQTDALLQWATRYAHGQFGLLKHAPLKVTSEYNTRNDQYKTLREAGWTTVIVRDLWSIWQDVNIISVDERKAVCQVEYFDDLEELAQYGRQYIVITADMQPRDRTGADTSSDSTACTVHPVTIDEEMNKLTLDQPSKDAGSATRSRQTPPTHSIPKATTIPTINLLPNLDFRTVVQANRPILLPNLNIGPCPILWSPSYLLEKLPPSTLLTIHTATSRNLTFHPTKNYTYAITTLSSFLAAALRHEHVYLRSLSGTSATQKPTSLGEDFPGIAGDFVIPELLSGVINERSVHSSVLRITGDVNMWLHYDVMANVLCQVRGSKRVVLFPSSDVSVLGFAPGDTTSELDIFSAEGAGNKEELRVPVGSHPVEVTLRPGDVLFIPPCWPHATAVSVPIRSNTLNEPEKAEAQTAKAEAEAEEDSPSTAINVFFRTFSTGTYAAGRDVYGNRDVAAYENGRRDLKRLIGMLSPIPGRSHHGEEEKVEEMYIAVAAFVSKGVKAICLEDRVVRLVEQIRRRFRDLPADVSDFYLRRLGDEVIEMGGLGYM